MDLIKISEFPDHKLKSPLTVSIMAIDGHFYCTNVDLGICASGLNPDEAFLNFKNDLGALYAKAQKIIEMVE